ncbi:hypothetical protein E3N88_45300 [Mikania micrantha]|uniref:Uncharacterized protein n=1 Tax=Mikania micrantha TaxID=192012 RepID=A0A5N6L9I6_9ASTR|nr:hypothetical protein E3N88_45300 [Mikania micrantha]
MHVQLKGKPFLLVVCTKWGHQDCGHLLSNDSSQFLYDGVIEIGGVISIVGVGVGVIGVCVDIFGIGGVIAIVVNARVFGIVDIGVVGVVGNIATGRHDSTRVQNEKDQK